MATRTRWVLAALVGVLAVLAVVFAAATYAADDSCTPEVRQAALSEDARAVVSGQLNVQAAAERQAERNARCDA